MATASSNVKEKSCYYDSLPRISSRSMKFPMNGGDENIRYWSYQLLRVEDLEHTGRPNDIKSNGKYSSGPLSVRPPIETPETDMSYDHLIEAHAADL